MATNFLNRAKLSLFFISEKMCGLENSFSLSFVFPSLCGASQTLVRRWKRQIMAANWALLQTAIPTFLNHFLPPLRNWVDPASTLLYFSVNNYGDHPAGQSTITCPQLSTINYYPPQSTINYQLLNIITRPTFLSRPIFPFNVPRSPWGSDSISLFLDIYLPVDQPFHRSNDLEEKGPITNYCQWLNTSFGRLCGISKLSQRSKKKH